MSPAVHSPARHPAAIFRARRWCSRLAFAAAGFVWIFASDAHAADDEMVISPRGSAHAEAKPAALTASSMSPMTLFLGLALAGAGGWMVWRNRRGSAVSRELRALSVDETRSLGNRQYLVVASYEGKKFLLGVCPGRIDMLSPLDGAASVSSTKVRE